MLSSNTCDKGVNDAKVLTQRIENLTKHGYYVMVTKSGMFLDNIDKIRSFNAYKDLHIIFPVGDDTIERFLRDWELFFDAEVEYKPMRYNNYAILFKNVEWFISKRKSETKNFAEFIPTYKQYLDNFNYSPLEIDDISSTMIRTGQIENIL